VLLYGLTQQGTTTIRLKDLKLNISANINAQTLYTCGESDRVYQSMWSSGLTDTGATTSYGVLSIAPPMINQMDVCYRNHVNITCLDTVTVCALYSTLVLHMRSVCMHACYM
jgi:hypothetical protein